VQPPFEFTDSFPTVNDDFVAKVPAGLRTADDLLQALYETLQFPGWFGFNWNALLDSLCDFHWTDKRRIVLSHEDLPCLDPSADQRVYLEILAEAVARWEANKTRTLVVIFPARFVAAVSEAITQAKK
jgi:hypothetical protein